MLDTIFDDALAFLDTALENEFLFGGEWLARRKAAFAQTPPRWDLRENLMHNRSLIMKYMQVRRLPNVKLAPAFNGKTRLPDEKRLLEQEAQFRKRHVFKASRYDSETYDAVVLCFVSGNLCDTNTIAQRYDVVLDGGTYKLANTAQTLCAGCCGAAAIKTLDCHSCEFEGYITPIHNPLGLNGAPVEIRRFEPRPVNRDEIYDADY